MREATQTNQRRSAYATRADFCRIFAEEMNSLYLLSYLLTADQEKAEQCFVAGVDDCAHGNSVFKEWARSWARRVIIQNAIRMVTSRPLEASQISTSAPSAIAGSTLLTEHAEVAAILNLPWIERFVFVMTVLERYSDRDCSILLGCSRQDVARARARALQRLGESAESSRAKRIEAVPEAAAHESRSITGPTALTPLATPA